MKTINYLICGLGLSALILSTSGCRTGTTTAAGANDQHFATKYNATDGRQIEIGRRTAGDGGWSFNDPHLNKCWIADGCTFNGYDVIYIAPTVSNVKIHDDEVSPHELAKQNLVIELQRELGTRGIFPKIVTAESEIPASGHVLKLENTIIEYHKGGGGARYWAGLYGAGQPVLRVQGKMTDGEKTVFTYEARRSGTSGAARVFGGYMTDVDIQLGDIRSMTLDLSDFMAAISGKYTPRN